MATLGKLRDIRLLKFHWAIQLMSRESKLINPSDLLQVFPPSHWVLAVHQ